MENKTSTPSALPGELQQPQRKSPTQIIDRSHLQLMDVQYELESLSFLLRAMGPGELTGELFGLGIALHRMHRRIEKVAEDLARLPRT